MYYRSPEEAVKCFIYRVQEFRDVLALNAISHLEFKDIVRMAMGGEIPREGILLNGEEYRVHGIGCMIVDQNGEEVDVDIGEGGGEIFDAWRVCSYLDAKDVEPSFSRNEIYFACLNLRDEGKLVEEKMFWFRIPKEKIDKCASDI